MFLLWIRKNWASNNPSEYPNHCVFSYFGEGESLWVIFFFIRTMKGLCFVLIWNGNIFGIAKYFATCINHWWYSYNGISVISLVPFFRVIFLKKSFSAGLILDSTFTESALPNVVECVENQIKSNQIDLE